MNDRELFLDILHYEDFDRMPLLHWGGWEETRKRWIGEGLDPEIPENTYFGVTAYVWGMGPDLFLYPPFEQVVYELLVKEAAGFDGGMYPIPLDGAEGGKQELWLHRGLAAGNRDAASGAIVKGSIAAHRLGDLVS